MKKYALYIVLSGVFLASCSRTTIDHRKTNETVLSDSVKARTDTREEQDKQQGHSTERTRKTALLLNLIRKSQLRKKQVYRQSKKSLLPVPPLIKKKKFIRRSTRRKI